MNIDSFGVRFFVEDGEWKCDWISCDKGADLNRLGDFVDNMLKELNK